MKICHLYKTLKSSLILSALLLPSLIVPTSLSADAINIESCTGIGNQWLGRVNGIVDQFEKKVNAAVDKYVSMLDFHKGDEKWALMGNAEMGDLHVPEFECNKADKYLQSAGQDTGFAPRYAIGAIVFGRQVKILEVSAGAGQDVRALKNYPAEYNPQAKRGMNLVVKLFGMNIVDLVKMGAAIKAKSKEESPVTGTGSSSSGGEMPQV